MRFHQITDIDAQLCVRVLHAALFARGSWPQRCGADMTLYIEAARPEATALSLPLRGADPALDTTIPPTPPARKPTE